MKVLFISGMQGDTRRYRCLHHQEQLALHGIPSDLREADDPQLYVDATTHDLFILHRVAYTDLIGDLIEIAHLRGCPVIFETDDLIFEPALYDSIAYIDTLSPEEANRFRQSLHGQAKTFARSDYVLTTTDYLATAAARHGKTVFIQRNAFSAEMIQVSEAAYQGARGKGQGCSPVALAPGSESRQSKIQNPQSTIILGYFSGSGSHNRDFATITQPLLEIMHRYPQVWLHLSGQLDIDPRLQQLGDRIRRAPYAPWQELPHLIARVDINLAPLEIDNPFCQAKSEIKYTEAALVGVPTVATPTDAFRHAIQHGENGLLAQTDAEWLAALTRLIENPDERHGLGEAARQHVYAHYTPEQRSQELLTTLQQIKARHTAPAADLAQAAVAVAQAMQRRLDDLLATHQQQTKQLAALRETLAAWQPKADNSHNFWRHSYEQAERQHLEALQSILNRLKSMQ